MTLSVALNAARSSLAATASQIALSGRNIAGASDPAYTRKIALTTTTADGSATILSISRASDLKLFQKMLGSTSTASGQQAILDGLRQLHETVGDTADGRSPAALLGSLSAALRSAGNTPDDRGLALAAIATAKDLAASLNAATAAVNAARQEADAAMATAVSRINDLLAQFQTLNRQIVAGTSTGGDITVLLDRRDAIIANLTGEIGLNVVYRSNNDVALYTDSGVPLFDVSARRVTFEATSAYGPGTVGNGVVVDGVPVTGDGATMPIRTGALAGLSALRDSIAPTYQAQLDEFARGLIEAFAESDQSGGGGPDAAGLFTHAGGPAVPPTGTLVTGIAGSIRVNEAVDPAAGGSVYLLRDGGINGSDYIYNASLAASFPDRLGGLVDQIDAQRAFDASARLGAGDSLAAFGTSSVAWLEAARKNASAGVDYQNAMLARASDALSNATGVNLDDEYAKQLMLEQSFAASSKLIAVVGQLFDALFEAVG